MKTLLVLALFLAVSWARPAEIQDPNETVYGMKKLFKVNFGQMNGNIYNVHARGPGDWSQCGGSDIKIYSLTLPDPVVMPGANVIGIDAELFKTLPNFKLDLKIQKKMGLWITIPCIDNIGSCTFDDICSLLNKNSTIIDIIEQLGFTACPFQPARITVADRVINLPELPPGIGGLVTGRYRIEAKVIEFGGRNEHLCLELEVEVTK